MVDERDDKKGDEKAMFDSFNAWYSERWRDESGRLFTRGELREAFYAAFGVPSAVAHSDCPDCGGTGSTPISTCLRCGGTGSLQSARAPLTDKELGEAYMAGVLASGKNADESEGHYAGLRAVLVAADSRSAKP